MKQLSIAIDGPAGAGKSTVAQIVAQRLRYIYIDTGAMYRAVAWAVLKLGISPSAADEIVRVAESLNIELSYVDAKTYVHVNGINITQDIRTPEVTGLVSAIAQLPGVRKAMTALQRQMGQRGGIVMDGRDIGTHVLPGADIKVFLTASIAERAKRRWLELKAKGYTIELAELQEDIRRRDEMDCCRNIAPLVKADDAVLLDTTKLSIEGAVQQILYLCEEKLRGLQSDTEYR